MGSRAPRSATCAGAGDRHVRSLKGRISSTHPQRRGPSPAIIYKMKHSDAALAKNTNRSNMWRARETQTDRTKHSQTNTIPKRTLTRGAHAGGGGSATGAAMSGRTMRAFKDAHIMGALQAWIHKDTQSQNQVLLGQYKRTTRSDIEKGYRPGDISVDANAVVRLDELAVKRGLQMRRLPAESHMKILNC